MNSSQYSIEVRGVTKEYRQATPVLHRLFGRTPSSSQASANGVRNVSFSVDAGGAVGILGPNGAGKSTMFKLLCGIMSPTVGEVSVCGMDPFRCRGKVTQRIGVVMGHKSLLFWDIPARRSLLFCRDLYGVDTKVFRQRFDHLVEHLDLESLLPHPPKRLSLGQRRLLDFACACLHSPQVLLLDEPTLGLDFMVRRKVYGLIERMRQTTGATVILISHNINDIEATMESVVVLDSGSVSFQGGIKTLQACDPMRTIGFTLAELSGEVPGVLCVDRDMVPIHLLDNGSYEISCRREQVSRIVGRIVGEFKVDSIEIQPPRIEGILETLYAAKGDTPSAGVPLATTGNNEVA